MPCCMNHENARKSVFHHKIHESALRAAQDFRRAEAALIEALIAVERERVFVALGFSSLFAYAVSLGLSEAVAYNAITVARKAREIPELRVEIQNGTLSVSKAKKTASVLTQTNHAEWIERAKTLPAHTLEQEVTKENPRAEIPERAKYVDGQRLALTLGVEEPLPLIGAHLSPPTSLIA